jgi:hypothetical protein
MLLSGKEKKTQKLEKQTLQFYKRFINSSLSDWLIGWLGGF